MGTSETDKQHFQDVKDLVAINLERGEAHLDLAYIGGHHAVVVTDQTMTFRFGIFDGEWAVESRNHVCDPPDQWDTMQDGPAPTAEDPASDVADWILASFR